MSNKKQSSVKVAKIASKALRNPKSSEITKVLAASVVSQARGKRKK